MDSPQTVWVACVIIYAINYGLGVVGPEMTMDFGSTKWNRCLVRGLPTDSPQHGCGTVKNSPGLLDCTKNCSCVICMELLEMIGLELCERNVNAWNLMC